MTTNTILTIILLIIIIGIFFYFSRHFQNYHDNFADDISVTSSIRNKYRTKKRKKQDDLSDQIDVDIIVSDCSSNKSNHSSTDMRKIEPSNLDYLDNTYQVEEDTLPQKNSWQSHFGQPLMNKKDRQKFIDKIKKNYHSYQNSLDEFGQYQTDKNTLIKTDIHIDPFQNHQDLKGRTIKEIYDNQVAGPKAIPKMIKKQIDHCTIYDNEDEMNGGLLQYSGLYGYNANGTSYRSAAHHNDF